MSQPSLSAQLAQLEDALGVQLFERDRRRVLATSPAEELLTRARRVLLEATDLLEAARRLADPLTGVLRVGVIPTVAPYLLPEVTPALHARFPALSVLWTEDKTEAIVDALEHGRLDAGLLALEANLGDVATAEIARDPFVLAGPRDHPLLRKRKKTRSLSELSSTTVHLLDDGHCFRDQALDLCRATGAQEAAFRATSLSTLVQVVANGDAVTLLPTLALEVENRHGELAVRALEGPAPHRTIALVWRHGSPLEAALQEVASVLREAYPTP